MTATTRTAAVGLDERDCRLADLAACAEGYSFPTNLDHDQPIGGLAPATQAELLARAVEERWPQARLDSELQAWSDRRRTTSR
jgi:hypothetical protein